MNYNEEQELTVMCCRSWVSCCGHENLYVNEVEDEVDQIIHNEGIETF